MNKEKLKKLKYIIENLTKDENYNFELDVFLSHELTKDEYPEFLEYIVPIMDKLKLDNENEEVIISIATSIIGDLFKNNELEEYLSKILEGYISKETIKEKINAPFLFKNEKEWRNMKKEIKKESIPIERIHAATINGKVHIRTLHTKNKRKIMSFFIHEYLHIITSNNNYKKCKNQSKFSYYTTSGVKINYFDSNKEIVKSLYNNINEAITEYLTKQAMGDLYPFDNPNYPTLVSRLEELVDKGFLDNDTIIKAYTKNDIKILARKINKKDQLNRNNYYEPILRIFNIKEANPKDEQSKKIIEEYQNNINMVEKLNSILNYKQGNKR